MTKKTRIHGTVVDRLMAYATPDPTTGCMIWTRGVQHGFPILQGPGGRKVYGHRAAWEHFNGPIPTGRQVSHTCGNKLCVNPKHLCIGDLACNVRDAEMVSTLDHLASDQQRFLEKVDKNTANGCWLWTGADQAAGSYGLFWLHDKLIGAHRASHILFKGPIPAGYVVMHTCDDRRCVNPAHLVAGTPSDNMQDMVRKGRATKARATIDRAIAAKIKGEYFPRHGEMTRLADKYMTSVQVVNSIISGRTWVDVQPDCSGRPPEAPPISDHYMRGENHPNSKLTAEIVTEIRKRKLSGEPRVNIAIEFAQKLGVTTKVIYEVMRGTTWKSVVVEEPGSNE